jgi:hypothetical protein
MWSSIAVVAIAAGVAVFAIVDTAHGQGGGGPPYKNLQVMPKNITKDQLKSYMKFMAKSLDVECDHCHEPPDMAADKKDAKNIARQMMKMTDEINGKWLKGMKDIDKNYVTCGTCHRGATTPPKFP